MLSRNDRKQICWQPPPLSRAGQWSLFCCLVSSLLFHSGCSRSFWRSQADRDAYEAMYQVENDPRWVNPRKSLMPDPRSRFFDPYDPDREPLTPDDPAAEQSMDQPGILPGYRSWHRLGQSLTVENPGWLSQFQLTPEMQNPETGEYEGVLPTIPDLTIPQAVELTYLHSRDYQFELEEAYLAALALTLEQFRFQVRYLGIGGGEPSGSLRYDNIPGTRDAFAMNNRIGVAQLLPTGGQWAVELANNTLWIFSGPNAGTNSASLLSYRLVQPLMLGAGRQIALENLTQSERDLLYAVRDLSRFRKTLFVQTVSGGAGGGYLGLLTQLQGIRNQEYNIVQLERQVRELRALAAIPPGATDADLEQLPVGLQIPAEISTKLEFDPERKKLIWFGAMTEEQANQLRSLSEDPAWLASSGELIQLLLNTVTPLDVAQLESRLARAIIQLRSTEQRFHDNLDAYKAQLGLPPDMRVKLNESGLEQFVLIDPKLQELQAEIEDMIVQTGILDKTNVQPELVRTALLDLEKLYQKILLEAVPLVENDNRKVDEKLPQRLAYLETEADRERVIETVAVDRQRLKTQIGLLQTNRADFVKIRSLIDRQEPSQEDWDTAIDGLKKMREDLLRKVQSLTVIQVGLRSELIDINRYRFSMEDSVGLALENRLDLMNARADVVDARRNMEVVANRLKAVVDVVVEGDIRNEPGSSKPFNFSGRSSDHRVGLQFTAPLDQVAERNAYRASQITYQRARRNYMEFEDAVKLDIRTEWRNLQILEQNLETARQALRINVIQYDQAVEESNAPNQSNQGGVRGRNLVDALNSILDSQDQLVEIWADYERSRLNIHRDMEMMVIDPNGIWEDDYYQNLARNLMNAYPETDLLPPEPTAGDFDVLLIPPGPAGNDYVSDITETESIESNRSPGQRTPPEQRTWGEQFPAPVAREKQVASRTNQTAGEPETAFNKDPLGWQPGHPPARLLFDQPDRQPADTGFGTEQPRR